MISRLQKATPLKRGKGHAETRHIVGLIPEASGPMSPEMITALTERQTLMESRAAALAATAVAAEEPWLKRLGTPPINDADRSHWLNEVSTVAAYRNRYRADGRRALGEPRTAAQKLDAAQAQKAIRRARAIADQDDAVCTEGRRALNLDRQTIG